MLRRFGAAKAKLGGFAALQSALRDFNATMPAVLPGLVRALRWGLLALLLGVSTGSACALFLWLLQWATLTRWDHPWLLYLLPLVGLLVGWAYHRWAGPGERGNNLLIDAVFQPSQRVPLRMAPMVLVGTVLSHLCGASAGREGTAVQMGGALAAWFARLGARVLPAGVCRADLIIAGIAAGFSGVFGTPLAGIIFAWEVTRIGRVERVALLPVIISSVLSDRTCHVWGIGHTAYPQVSALFSATLLWQVALLGLLSGPVSWLFVAAQERLKTLCARLAPWPPLRPVLGGVALILLFHVFGTDAYLGLGVSSSGGSGPSIVNAFVDGGVDGWSWLWKLLFTAVTLAAGFKGGEVTPLFFIGACLGHSVALVLGMPIEVGAALGFVAVFAGATRTPLACAVMGVELFGGGLVLPLGLVCLLAQVANGKQGIYSAQRSAVGEGNPSAKA